MPQFLGEQLICTCLTTRDCQFHGMKHRKSDFLSSGALRFVWIAFTIEWEDAWDRSYCTFFFPWGAGRMAMHLRSKISPVPLSPAALLWSASHQKFEELRKYGEKQGGGSEYTSTLICCGTSSYWIVWWVGEGVSSAVMQTCKQLRVACSAATDASVCAQHR